MPDFGPDDPLSAAVRGDQPLMTATPPGGGALDRGFGGLLNRAIDSRQAFEQRRQDLFNQLANAYRGSRSTGGRGRGRVTYSGGIDPRAIQAELRDMEFQDRMDYMRSKDAENRAYLQGRDADRTALANQRRSDASEKFIYQQGRDAERFGLQRDRFGFEQDRDEEREADFAANQRRLVAHDNALEQDKAIRRERDTRIDREGADAMVRMHQLDTAYRGGQISKDDYDDGMLQLGQTHFEALHRHPEAAKHWAEYLDQDEKQSQYRQRLNLREAAKLKARYGVDIAVDPNSGEIDFDSMHRAVLGTPKGRGEALNLLNNEMIKRYGLPTSAVFEHAAGGTLEKPGDPNSFKQTDPSQPQSHVRMQVLTPNGVQHNIVVEKPRFDAIKAEFEPAYNEITQAGQQPQPSETTPVTQ